MDMGLGVPHVGCLARNKAPAHANDFPRAFPVERDNIREPDRCHRLDGRIPRSVRQRFEPVIAFLGELAAQPSNLFHGPLPQIGTAKPVHKLLIVHTGTQELRRVGGFRRKID